MKIPVMVAATLGLGSIALQHTELFSGAFTRAPEVQSVPQVAVEDRADDEAADEERRRLVSQLEAEREEAEKAKRDHEWEMESLRLRQNARMRELEYQRRTAEDVAEEARRRQEAETVAHRQALAEEREQSEQALRRAWAEKPAPTQTVIVERQVPVYVPRVVVVPPRPLVQHHRPRAGGLSDQTKKRQTP